MGNRFLDLVFIFVYLFVVFVVISMIVVFVGYFVFYLIWIVEEIGELFIVEVISLLLLDFI